MTPPERRRAEDVEERLEREIFPRLGGIDSKLIVLDAGMTKLLIEGCPQRKDDLRRTEAVEEVVPKIFDKLDRFGQDLSLHQISMSKQIDNVRVWVLTGVAVVLFSLAGYFGAEYLRMLATKRNGHSAPAGVVAPVK